MSASVPPHPSGATPATPTGAASDPSMEDILASIRRILSEDEQAAKPADTAAPPNQADDDGDVLSLDDSMLVAEPLPSVEQPAAVAAQPIDRAADLLAAMSAPGEPLVVVAAPSLPPLMQVAPDRPIAPERLIAPDRLIAPEAEAATASSVHSLLRTLESGRAMPVYRGGPTLEDMVREELRALLKEWLDANLPPMVERLVRAEIDRVVGRAVG